MTEPSPKNYWNYRVTKSVVADTGEEIWGIREMYYRDGMLAGWSSQPVPVEADTELTLKFVYEKFADAFTKPPLDLDEVERKLVRGEDPERDGGVHGGGSG